MRICTSRRFHFCLPAILVLASLVASASAVRFDRDVLVNDDTSGGANQISADISPAGTGRFIVTWEDYRRADFAGDIYCQYLDSLGTPIDSNFRMNEEAPGPGLGSYRHAAPCVAGSRTGSAAAVWEDYRLGKSQIYCQLLGPDRNPTGPNRRVSPDTMAQTGPDIAACGDVYALAWELPAGVDLKTVYGALVDASGGTTRRFRIADNPPTEDCRSPALSGFHAGFVAAWEQGGNASHARLRWFDSAGNALGPSLGIAFDGAARPRVACDTQGDGLVAWEEAGTPQRIWAQTFDASGSMTSPVFQVNDSGPTFRYHPAVAAAPGGELFLVVWEDARTADTARIYGQLFDRWGTALGRNFRLDSSPRMKSQGSPGAAFGEAGWWSSVWVDNRDDNVDVYGACYGRTNHFFRANRDQATSIQACPVVVRDGSGRVGIFWEDQRDNSYGPRIFGRWFASELAPQGPSFRVSDGPPGQAARMGWAAANRLGLTVIAWQDFRAGNPDIYAQFYDPEGRPMGPNFRVNDDAGVSEQISPFAAINDSGRSVIVWTDGRLGHGAPYAQEFDRLGQRIGYNWQVDSAGTAGSVVLGSAGDEWFCWSNQDTIRARHFAQGAETGDWRPGTGYRPPATSHQPPATDLRSPPHAPFPSDTAIILSDSTSRHATQPRLAKTWLGTVWVVWVDSAVTRPGARNLRLRASPQSPVPSPQPLASGHSQVFARMVSSAGSPIRGVFRIGDDADFEQMQAAVASDTGHWLYVLWTDLRTPGDIDARCLAFDSSGTAAETSFIVAQDCYPAQLQWTYGPPAADPGSVVFAWQDNRRLRSWDIYASIRDPGAKVWEQKPPAPSQDQLEIAPSIVAGECRISLAGDRSSFTRLGVFDAAGREIGRLELKARSGAVLDCRALANGIYWVRGPGLGGRFAVLH